MEFLLNMVFFIFFILNKNRIIRGDFLQVEILNVIQCHKVAGKGVTKPCYVTLDNGTNVYIKYPNNPEGDLVLLNEWISASIGKLVNINIPNFGLCYLLTLELNIKKTVGNTRFAPCFQRFFCTLILDSSLNSILLHSETESKSCSV